MELVKIVSSLVKYYQDLIGQYWGRSKILEYSETPKEEKEENYSNSKLVKGVLEREKCEKERYINIKRNRKQEAERKTMVSLGKKSLGKEKPKRKPKEKLKTALQKVECLEIKEFKGEESKSIEIDTLDKLEKERVEEEVLNKLEIARQEAERLEKERKEIILQQLEKERIEKEALDKSENACKEAGRLEKEREEREEREEEEKLLQKLKEEFKHEEFRHIENEKLERLNKLEDSLYKDERLQKEEKELEFEGLQVDCLTKEIEDQQLDKQKLEKKTEKLIRKQKAWNGGQKKVINKDLKRVLFNLSNNPNSVKYKVLQIKTQKNNLYKQKQQKRKKLAPKPKKINPRAANAKIEKTIVLKSKPISFKSKSNNRLKNRIFKLETSIKYRFICVQRKRKRITQRNNKLSEIKISNDNLRNINRLKDRIRHYRFRESSTPIPADGNCQFHSLSDQLYGDTNHSNQIRREIVNWLRENFQFPISNSTLISDYVIGDYKEYCDKMARNGEWGDHITLIAAAELYGRRITIVTSVFSVTSDNHLVIISPSTPTFKSSISLSHISEYHYGSLNAI